jgi:SAM-dependent methyltransferase
MKTVEIELGGATRRLSLDLNSVIALQAQAGADIITLGQQLADKKATVADKMRTVRLITWAMLASDCPSFEDNPASLRTVGSWLSIEDLPRLAGAISDLLSDYMERVGKSGMSEFPGQMAPYVPTPAPVVEAMLRAAQIKDHSMVVDLGAGDGRLLFRALEMAENVIAFGYEMHQERFDALSLKAKRTQSVFFQKDIREADLSGADVVFLYLLPTSNAELKAKLLAECKPGCRIVSHDFGMPDWEPEHTERVLAEDRAHTVYRWTVPARAAAAD